MPDPHVRASDAEREAARSRLTEHMAEGRISLEEYHERADAILNARTRADLEVPFHDLPAPVPAVPPPAPVPIAERTRIATERALAIIGSFSVLIFFVLGFALDAWQWAWLVFLLPGAVGGRMGGHRRLHARRR